MVINLNNLIIAIGIIAVSYLLGDIAVWNGPFSSNREWAAKWPARYLQWGLQLPQGIFLITPFVAAFFLIVTDRNRKIGFSLLILGCFLANVIIFLSLHVHD